MGMISFKEIARFQEESGAAADFSSVLTGAKDNAHNIEQDSAGRKKRPRCPNALIFQEVNAAGCWIWRVAPCERWVCEACYEWRLETELIPEIVQALAWGKETGWTLKFLTLTYLDTDLGAQPTEEGRDRRRKDLAHFKQSLKRKGISFEYLKIVESHKSGKIHMHFLVMMPYVHQPLLVAAWRGATRGTSRIVDIEAAAMKCPRCYPGRKAPRKEKRRSMIVPPPGRAECLCCGYQPDWVSFVTGEVAEDIAKELAKYLTKELSVSEDKLRVKKLTRSKLWTVRCVPRDSLEQPAATCSTCQGPHRLEFVGKAATLVREGCELLEDIKRDEPVVYYPAGGVLVNCWGDRAVVVESWSQVAELGLVDVQVVGSFESAGALRRGFG